MVLVPPSKAELNSYVSSAQVLRTEGCWGDLRARPKFFPRIDDNHCLGIHSSLSAVNCFDNGYVEKQPVAGIEYCAEYW